MLLYIQGNVGWAEGLSPEAAGTPEAVPEGQVVGHDVSTLEQRRESGHGATEGGDIETGGSDEGKRSETDGISGEEERDGPRENGQEVNGTSPDGNEKTGN